MPRARTPGGFCGRTRGGNSRKTIRKRGTVGKVHSRRLPTIRTVEKSMSFANKVAVITGASSGIGWELAKVLAGHGSTVGLLARRLDRLEALAADIRAAGGQAAAAQANVTERHATVAAIHRLR